MRKLALLCAFAFAASLALAQEPPAQQPPRQQPPPDQPAQPASKTSTKEFSAQVVSTDPVAKTITIKKEPSIGGMETTLPVEADAVTALKTVMAGEKVKLTCKTDSGGKETAVTAIKKEPKTNR